MERLSLNDTTQSGSTGSPPEQNAQDNAPVALQPPPAQLPVQMFTTAAQLLDLTDSEPSRVPAIHGAPYRIEKLVRRD